MPWPRSFYYDIEVNGADVLEATLSGAPQVLHDKLRDAMQDSIHLAEAEIKTLTPRRTGFLMASWNTSVSGYGEFLTGRVSSNVRYGRYVEWDTRPHEIVAHGEALMLPISRFAGTPAGEGRSIFGYNSRSGHFIRGQQVAFFKKVNHPGTSGQHMMVRGFLMARPEILRRFRLAVREAMQTIRGLPR